MLFVEWCSCTSKLQIVFPSFGSVKQGKTMGWQYVRKEYLIVKARSAIPCWFVHRLTTKTTCNGVFYYWACQYHASFYSFWKIVLPTRFGTQETHEVSYCGEWLHTFSNLPAALKNEGVWHGQEKLSLAEISKWMNYMLRWLWCTITALPSHREEHVIWFAGSQFAAVAHSPLRSIATNQNQRVEHSASVLAHISLCWDWFKHIDAKMFMKVVS